MARGTPHAVGASVIRSAHPCGAALSGVPSLRSVAARLQTRVKNVFTTEIAETTEETHCFHSVVSAISVAKQAFLLVWEIQLAERMLLWTRACC